MILIVSDSSDASTNHVMDWIRAFNYPVTRINADARIHILEYSPNDSTFTANILDGNQCYSIASIESVWYRRGRINFDLPVLSESDCMNHLLRDGINEYLMRENNIATMALLHHLQNKKSLNSPLDLFVNKLIVLKIAQEVGFKIPDSILTSQPERLHAFKHRHGRIICKPLNTGPLNAIAGYRCESLTSEVTDSDIDSYGPHNRPSFVQELIPKICDVRLFYINEDIYASAIFSQGNAKTAIDFRNYDTEKPNKVDPIELPNDLKAKIVILMKRLGYNSGSIDFVLSVKGEFIFLEVNPVGQFAQVSVPCNYYIERRIALELISDDCRRSQS